MASTVSNPDMVFQGHQGRLFLCNDSNGVLEQHRGKLRLSSAELDKWVGVLSTRRRKLEAQGIPFAFLIAPNAHSVFSDALPGRHAPRRSVHDLLDRLVAAGEPPALYPLAELQAVGERAFPLTDTHWSALGAFHGGYRPLYQALGAQAGILDLSVDDFRWVPSEIAGDLGAKLRPPRHSVTWNAVPRRPGAEIVFDNRVQNRGRLRIMERSDGQGACVLLFGDSFSWRILDSLGHACSRLIFAHGSSLDRELIDEHRPDAVIGVLTERFLMKVPDDSSALGVRRMAEFKRSAGRVLSRHS